MGILDEQKKTNKLLEEQRKASEKSEREKIIALKIQNQESAKQTELLKLAQDQKDFQKFIKDTTFELKTKFEVLRDGSLDNVNKYIGTLLIKGKLDNLNLTSQSFENLEDKEYFSKLTSSLQNLIDNIPEESKLLGNSYFESCGKYLNEINKREEFKKYLSSLPFGFKNKLVLKDNSINLEKDNKYLIGISLSSVAGLALIGAAGIGLLIPIAYFGYLIYKLPKSNEQILKELSIDNDLSGFKLFFSGQKILESKIEEKRKEFENFRFKDYPELKSLT